LAAGGADLAWFGSVSDDLRLIVAVTLLGVGVAHRLFEAPLAGEDKNQRVERDTQVEPERSMRTCASPPTITHPALIEIGACARIKSVHEDTEFVKGTAGRELCLRRVSTARLNRSYWPTGIGGRGASSAPASGS